MQDPALTISFLVLGIGFVVAIVAIIAICRSKSINEPKGDYPLRPYSDMFRIKKQ